MCKALPWYASKCSAVLLPASAWSRSNASDADVKFFSIFALTHIMLKLHHHSNECMQLVAAFIC